MGTIKPGSARGRPGRSGRRGRRRGLLGRHGGRSRAWGRLRLFLGRSRLAGRHGRPCGRQFDKHRVWHQTLPLGVAAVRRWHHPHRHGLALVAGKREAHRELTRRHRERAGGSARLSKRCSSLGTGGFGLELHGRRRGRRLHEARRLELHPARHTRASGKAHSAGCNCGYSFHDQYRSLMQPNGRVTHTRTQWERRSTAVAPRDASPSPRQPASPPETVPRAQCARVQ